MQLRALLLATLVSLACVVNVAQAAEPEITWYATDFPPLYIVNGPQRGQGYYDLVLKRHLIPALTDYKHRYVDDLPIQRVQMLLDTDAASCQVGLFNSPERQRKWAVSEPFLAPIPPGAFLRRRDAPRLAGLLDADGKLSLSKVLESGKMTVGVRSGRSYGAGADAVLKAFDGKPNVFRLTTPDAAKSLFQMVAAERVDVVLGYPYEAAYHLAQDDPSANKALKFYLLSEQAEFVLVHVVCAKSPLGQDVIRKVDAALTQGGMREAILSHYEAWLDDDLRPLARRLQKQALLHVGKP